MIMCAKFAGRDRSTCTRGEACRCLNEPSGNSGQLAGPVADVELLPLPEPVVVAEELEFGAIYAYERSHMEAYARANLAPLQAENERLRAEVGRLRDMLRTVSAVGVVQLFDTARDDVLAEFSLAELQEISRVTEHKRPEQVERIYREGWDTAIDQARGKENGNG